MNEGGSIPGYVKVSEFAQACRLTIWKARRILRKNEILEDVSGFGQCAEPRKILEKLPGFYSKVYEYFVYGKQNASEEE